MSPLPSLALLCCLAVVEGHSFGFFFVPQGLKKRFVSDVISVQGSYIENLAGFTVSASCGSQYYSLQISSEKPMEIFEWASGESSSFAKGVNFEAHVLMSSLIVDSPFLSAYSVYSGDKAGTIVAVDLDRSTLKDMKDVLGTLKKFDYLFSRKRGSVAFYSDDIASFPAQFAFQFIFPLDKLEPEALLGVSIKDGQISQFHLGDEVRKLTVGQAYGDFYCSSNGFAFRQPSSEDSSAYVGALVDYLRLKDLAEDELTQHSIYKALKDFRLSRVQHSETTGFNCITALQVENGAVSSIVTDPDEFNIAVKNDVLNIAEHEQDVIAAVSDKKNTEGIEFTLNTYADWVFKSMSFDGHVVKEEEPMQSQYPTPIRGYLFRENQPDDEKIYLLSNADATDIATFVTMLSSDQYDYQDTKEIEELFNDVSPRKPIVDDKKDKKVIPKPKTNFLENQAPLLFFISAALIAAVILLAAFKNKTNNSNVSTEP